MTILGDYPPREFESPSGAQLVLRRARAEDVVTWLRHWRPRLQGQPAASWPWATHIPRAEREPGFECLVIESIGPPATLEAMLSLSLDDSRRTRGARLVYVEYVGVAPDNLGPPIGRRALRGLGSLLVREAAAVSQAAGFDGRVGLHALPEVETYYPTLWFDPGQREETEDGALLYFELEPANAQNLLTKGPRSGS